MCQLTPCRKAYEGCIEQSWTKGASKKSWPGMREIKFRTWNGESNNWTIIFSTNNGRVFFKDTATASERNLQEWQQFTGLKDKNGREIYEGDVVMYPDTESEYIDVGIGNVKVAEQEVNGFFSVEFRNGEFGLEIDGSEAIAGTRRWISLRELQEDYCAPEDIEVIGNVYESPELSVGQGQ